MCQCVAPQWRNLRARVNVWATESKPHGDTHITRPKSRNRWRKVQSEWRKVQTQWCKAQVRCGQRVAAAMRDKTNKIRREAPASTASVYSEIYSHRTRLRIQRTFNAAARSRFSRQFHVATTKTLMTDDIKSCKSFTAAGRKFRNGATVSIAFHRSPSLSIAFHRFPSLYIASLVAP